MERGSHDKERIWWQVTAELSELTVENPDDLSTQKTCNGDVLPTMLRLMRAVEHFFKRSTIGGIMIFSDAWPSREGNCDPQKVVPQFGAPAIHELFIRQLGLCFCARADGPE
jgi:hypothetical protein